MLKKPGRAIAAMNTALDLTRKTRSSSDSLKRMATPFVPDDVKNMSRPRLAGNVYRLQFVEKDELMGSLKCACALIL